MDINSLSDAVRKFNPSAYGKQKPLPTLDAAIDATNTAIAERNSIGDRLTTSKAKVADLQAQNTRLTTDATFVSSLSNAQRGALPERLTNALLEQNKAQQEWDFHLSEHGDLNSQLATLQADKSDSDKAATIAAGKDIVRQMVAALQTAKSFSDQYNLNQAETRRRWPNDPPLRPIIVDMFDDNGHASAYDSLLLFLVGIDPSLVPADNEVHGKLARMRQQQADQRSAFGLK